MKKAFLCMLIVLLISASAAWGKVGGGDITFSVKGASDVLYSHDVHVTRAGLKCTNCHYKVYSMSQQNKRTTMAEMEKGESCGTCHNGKQAFDVKANCEKCHKK